MGRENVSAEPQGEVKEEKRDEKERIMLKIVKRNGKYRSHRIRLLPY